MTITTTSYGTWSSRVTPYNLTLESQISDALDRWDVTDEQLDQIARAYRQAINAALPASVWLSGNEFYGHAHEADCADQADYPHDEDGRLDLEAIVDTVDFWAIADPILETITAPSAPR